MKKTKHRPYKHKDKELYKGTVSLFTSTATRPVSLETANQPKKKGNKAIHLCIALALALA